MSHMKSGGVRVVGPWRNVSFAVHNRGLFAGSRWCQCVTLYSGQWIAQGGYLK